MISRCSQLLLVLLVGVFVTTTAGANPVDVLTLGLKADSKTDDAPALQAALDAGKTDLAFPRGTYLLGGVTLPADARLSFAPGARVRVNVAKLIPTQVMSGPGESRATHGKVLFVVGGDNVTIEGLDVDFSRAGGAQVTSADLDPVIFAAGRSRLRFRGLRAIRQADRELRPEADRTGGGNRYVKGKRGDPGPMSLVIVNYCRDVVLADSQAEHMSIMIEAVGCADVTAQGNRAVSCLNISAFHGGSEWMRHINNWSRDVRYQCVFRGSNANDVRGLKEDDPRRGTANEVIRGPHPDDPDFKPGTLGSFDVQIANNYAEYGRTLAWGNKGRQVVFDGNIGRFMTDYTLGTEGSENVVFSNNISVNSAVAGIACYYWSEKLVITGNLVVVRDEAFDPFWAWRTEQQYQGSMLRLHAINHPQRKTGSGKAIVTGNLFVSELTDRMRQLRVEYGRDVLISGNKIVNAQVYGRSADTGTLSILGNEFIHTTREEYPAIRTIAPCVNLTIKDNVLRRGDPFAEFNKTAPTPAAEPTSPQPAIVVPSSADKGASVRLIEGNQVQGWSQSILAQSLSPSTPDRFVLRNNNVDGTIRMEAEHGRCRFFADGNLDLNSMKVVPVRLTPLSPAAKATPDDTREANDPVAEDEGD